MAAKLYALHDLPSPYYRVATRAVILDEEQHILIAENPEGNYELIGGGWEYDEPLEVCLRREIAEELGVEADSIGRDIIGVYRGRNPYGMTLKIAVRATLKSYDFQPVDMVRAWFVTREEFMRMDFKPTADEGLKDFANIIWDGELV